MIFLLKYGFFVIDAHSLSETLSDYESYIEDPEDMEVLLRAGDGGELKSSSIPSVELPKSSIIEAMVSN